MSAPPPGGLAPPSRGNPGSVTEIVQLLLPNYFRSNGTTATKIVQFSFLFSQRKTQYKLLFTILNNIKAYEKPVPRTKNIPHRSVKFEAGEENRIAYESFY